MTDAFVSRALGIDGVQSANGAKPVVDLGALLDDMRREIRVAEQAAHAERMRRLELQEELARRKREQTEADVIRDDLAAAWERIREMRAEREQWRREVAEAEHRAAVIASRAPPAPAPALPAPTRATSAPTPAPTRGTSSDRARELLNAERTLTASRTSPLTLVALRGELAQLRAMIEREQAAPLEGASPGATASVSRDATEQQREAASGPGSGSVDAARLEAALTRLRSTAPECLPDVNGAPPAAEPAPAGTAWLAPVFRTIAKRDPAGAGRLAVALLPAQPLVQPLPLAYDLVLTDFGCVAVTAAAGAASVELRDTPRPREEVQLQVRGELASMARLLAAGPVRRRVRRGLARAKGERRTLNALRALVRAPLSIEQLRAAGVRPHPTLALSLLAAMIEPGWTAGERFTVAHREPGSAAADACLRVRDGLPVTAGVPAEAPPGDLGAATGRPATGPATTTVACPAASLLCALGVAVGPDVVIDGDPRPVAVLQSWIKRAQSG